MMALDHLLALLDATLLRTLSRGSSQSLPAPQPPLETPAGDGDRRGELQGAPSDVGTLALCSPTAHLKLSVLSRGYLSRGYRISPPVSLPPARAFGRLPAAVRVRCEQRRPRARREGLA